MDDFEYSIQISERDWDCIIHECEECKLLPPVVDGVDSGTSDIEVMGSIPPDRILKVDPTSGFMEADHPIDGPPDCEGSPVEHYLSEYSVGGMEDMLSGSEEDIHLQSVNTFFERLSLTGTERPIEPSQEVGGNHRDIVHEEELCSDGPQASCSASQKTFTKLNFLPARSQTATGEEATQTTNGNINSSTVNKVEPDSEIGSEYVDSSSNTETNKLTHTETKLVVRVEDWVVTIKNELSLCIDTAPTSDQMLSIKVNMCQNSNDAKYGDASISPTNLITNLEREAPCNVEEIAEDKLQKRNVHSPSPGSYSSCPHKEVGSDFTKRKSTRKKTVTPEPEQRIHGIYNEFHSESEEDHFAWKKEMDSIFLEGRRVPNAIETQKADSSVNPSPSCTDVFQRPAFIGNDSDRIPPFGSVYDTQYHISPKILDQSERRVLENISFGKGNGKEPDLPGDNSSTDKSPFTPGQTDESLMLTAVGGNVATNFQPCKSVQLQDTTGLTRSPGSWTLITSYTNENSGLDPARRSYNRTCQSACEEEAVRVGNLQPFEKVNKCLANRSLKDGKDPNSSPTEVISITEHISQSRNSNDPGLEAGQNDEEATTEPCLSVEVGLFARDDHTICQSVGSDTRELNATGIQHFKTRPYLAFTENSRGRACSDLTVEPGNLSVDKIYSCVSSYMGGIRRKQETENSLTISKPDGFSETTPNERTDSIAQHVTASPTCDTDFLPYEEIISTPTNSINNNYRLSIAEGLLNSKSNITLNEARSDLETDQNYRALSSKETQQSLSDESTAEISENMSSSVSLNTLRGKGETIAEVMVTDTNNEGETEHKKQEVAQDTPALASNLGVKIERLATLEDEMEAQNDPDSKNTVFAMSSFWNQMEKLTINDILHLRTTRNASPLSFLPPSSESDDADTTDAVESVCFPQLDNARDDHSSSDLSGVIDSVNSSSNSNAIRSDSVSSIAVTRQGEPDPLSLVSGVYPQNKTASVSDIPQQLCSRNSSDKHRRKMSKNVSVRNLHALVAKHSSKMWESQTSATGISEESNLQVDYVSEGLMPRQDCSMESLPSSAFTEGILTESYRISVTGIFQYLFGEKKPNPRPSDPESIAPYYIGGNSVPETYDRFFSELDTGSFFYPLTEAADQQEDGPVPIFSCSSPVKRDLQFPEAYDNFFSSFSSDDCYTESDGQDSQDSGPIRVVSRFNCKTNEPQISTDIYEDFFTEDDLPQTLFWNTFSLRNIRFSGHASQEQRSKPLTLVPVDQIGRHRRRRTIEPINALDNRNITSPKPLLYRLDRRIPRQLGEQRLIYDDLQAALSNPTFAVTKVNSDSTDLLLLDSMTPRDVEKESMCCLNNNPRDVKLKSVSTFIERIGCLPCASQTIRYVLGVHCVCFMGAEVC